MRIAEKEKEIKIACISWWLVCKKLLRKRIEGNAQNLYIYIYISQVGRIVGSLASVLFFRLSVMLLSLTLCYFNRENSRSKESKSVLSYPLALYLIIH